MNYENSIFFVRACPGQGDPSFGTAFLVHSDSQASYFVTCAHVIEEAVADGTVQVLRSPSDVGPVNVFDVRRFWVGSWRDRDLAVLATPRIEAPCLTLARTSQQGDEADLPGWFLDEETEPVDEWTFLPLRGTLDRPMRRANAETGVRTRSWYVRLANDEDYGVVGGYSGTPVIHAATRVVVGVVAQTAKTSNGYAIDIGELAHVWTGPGQTLRRGAGGPSLAVTEMPSALIVPWETIRVSGPRDEERRQEAVVQSETQSEEPVGGIDFHAAAQALLVALDEAGADLDDFVRSLPTDFRNYARSPVRNLDALALVRRAGSLPKRQEFATFLAYVVGETEGLAHFKRVAPGLTPPPKAPAAPR